MKLFRLSAVHYLLVVAVILCAMFLISHKGYSRTENPEKAAVLKEAAKILQPTRTDLSKKLFEYAYQEEQGTNNRKRWHEELVKTLEDASAALQKVDPAISLNLSHYADRMKAVTDHRAELRDREEDIDLLRDSGAVLQETDPILAGKLTRLASSKAARLQWLKDMETMEPEGASQAQQMPGKK